MKRTHSRFLAASSLILALCFAVIQARSARRPRYGGSLRVEMQAAIMSLDPAAPAADSATAAAKAKLTALVFDRLTRLGEAGEPQPALATSWEHDITLRNWTFHLRPGVKFQDGPPVTAVEIGLALGAINPDWQISFSGDTFHIALDRAAPDLPATLAGPRNAIVRRPESGGLIGTGPFRIREWQPGRRAVLAANEDSWEGRPYVDAIEITMGRAPREQMIDLDLGKADLVEVPLEQARRAVERGARISSAPPAELLALAFVPGRPAAEIARVSEALARSIDRAALVNFILQKQGEPAGGLLPQWASGYAFLFSTAADPAAARQLWSQISPVPPPLVLGYDAADPLEQAVAERIAVNARDAGIVVATLGQPPAAADAAADLRVDARVDARLIRLRMASLDPASALAGMLAALAPFRASDAAPLPDSAVPEELYARELAVVESGRVVPLVHLPEAFGLSPRIRNWTPPSAAAGGGWRLADIWLDLTGDRQ